MNNVNEKENNIPEKKNNKANIKKAWQTPEIIDLNLEETKGKNPTSVEVSVGSGPAS